MSKTEFPSPREPRQVEGRSLLSMDECRQIAGEFDGTTERIDALLKKWSAIKPGVKRHTIIRAAKCGGYQTTKDRKGWTPEEDRFLRENWHRMSADEIAAALGRGFNSVNLRRKRIGIGRYDGEDLTIRDLEELTRIDHRQWHDFVARGWLRARQRGRRKGAAPITYVSLNALRSLLTDHPEIYDYRRAPEATIVALELDRLPDPPAWKRVMCRSSSWREQVKPTPTGRTVTHGAAPMEMRLHTFRHRSCEEEGGTSFWAPLHASPSCPRCGCQVSRYSEEGLFTDLDPGNDEVIDIQARKLGLTWRDGKLRDANGSVVTGTGKSFGALVPALVMARSRGHRLVVSSSTVALQHQYAEKDAPLLQRAIPFGFTFAVARGRRRYACAAKLAAAAAEAGQREIDLGEAPPAADTSADRRRRTIIIGLAENFDAERWNGDRDDLAMPVPDEIWSDLTTDRQGCSGNRCAEFARCPFYAARQRVKEADLV